MNLIDILESFSKEGKTEAMSDEHVEVLLNAKCLSTNQKEKECERENGCKGCKDCEDYSSCSVTKKGRLLIRLLRENKIN